MNEWKNLSSTGYATTDELYTDFGTTKKALENWPAFKEAGFAIYTDATPHAGAALVQDVDYVLEDLDAAKTTEFSENIYSKLRMINNDTGDIYITYTAIGSYVPADVFQNMLSPYRPTALNISAGNQVTDLSVYERGGTSEKWNGWRIKISWTGGDKTYSHSFTGTTYTIGGLAIANYAGYGTGDITLKLDKDNGDWIIDNSNNYVFDYYQTAPSSGVYQIVYRYANQYKKIIIVDTNSRAITTNISTGVYTCSAISAITFSIAFTNVPRCVGGTSVGTATSNVSWVNFNGIQTASVSRALTLLAHASITATYEITHTYEGF